MAIRTWGAVRAKFWAVNAPIQVDNPISYGGSSTLGGIVDGSVSWTRYMSAIGSGAATFYATGDWEGFLVPGRICVIEQVTNHAVGGARLLACFIIEDVEPGVQNGQNVINVRGPGLESLLNKQLAWGQVGQTTTTNTTLAVEASAPSARHLAAGAPAGNETVILDSSNSDDIQQEIRITLNGGGTHVTTVTAREQYDGQWYLILADRLPGDADEGNDVAIWTRRIRVNNPAPFVEGASVIVRMHDGTDHVTLATGETDTTNRVNLRDALPKKANAGAAVTVSSAFAPTTSDVTQIVGFAPGWGVTFQTGAGTAVGSAHQPQGESVFEMLSQLAERTGEFFRQRVLSNPNAPIKSIHWRRTADSSGVTLVMYAPDETARQVTDETSMTRGAILSLKRRRSLPLITRVFPAAGDQQITLASCSTAAVNYAASLGCSIVPGVGLYEPDSVQHDAGVTAYGYHETRITYGDVSISEAKNATALIAACDQLLISAVQTLVTAQAREYYTIECYCPVALEPGASVKIENATGTTPEIDTSGNWIVLEVTESLVDGRPRTTLTVSNMSGLRWTAANQFASRLRAVVQGQRRIAARSGATVIATGGGGGEGGVTDHGLLTGLADDDHPQYLLVSGGRALAGNLTVNSGVTIDGVDISSHAANVGAHHAPVSAADASLVVGAGQTVRVSDSFAGAGLSLAGGIAAVNVATAQGTGITADALAVVPGGAGGLQNTASGLAVKLPANSGMVADANGLALGTPGTLTVATGNSVSGSQHFHALTATENAKTAPATLLKGSAQGDLTVRYGIADKLTTPLIDTAAGGLRLDPAGGVTTNDGDLSFVGARSILTDTGSLTLSPAATLVLSPDDNVTQVGPTTTLKTAHAAVGVFPQTGWQIDYNGSGYFTSLLADELHVQSFIADIMRVKVGGDYIPESMALIARDFTIPAVGGSDTLYVEDVPGWANIAAFAENDWVLLRIVSRPAGGLIVANAWGQVTNYVDRADGEQSWTFTTRIATSAAGQVARRGDLALDYGKTGAYWWYVTLLDPGGPHAGFGRWTGSNPTEGVQYPIRIGQLQGVSGVNELGFQAGSGASSRTRFSDLRNEIHGARLSLYAGDGGRLQVGAVDVVFYRTGTQSSTLVPDGDGTAVNVETTAANYFSAVNEGTTSPNYNTNIANAANLAGAVFLSLSNPATFSSIFRIDIKAALKSTGLSNDTIRLYGQVYESDELTPLTGEVLLATRTTNATATVTVTAPHTGQGAGGATQADWNGARLRLRWEYEINANEEAIRLDPGVPSIAVGNPLPTGTATGGDGLWAGLENGSYQTRIGNPVGARLTYDGNALRLTSGTTGAAIELNPTAQSIAVGNPLPTGFVAGGPGFWVGRVAENDYRVRIGNPNGARLTYNQGFLYLVNSNGDPAITLSSGGGSEFTGPMTIGAGGGIWQGANTFAAPRSGWKFWRDATGAGRFETYNSTGTPQVTITSNGYLSAGEGRVIIDGDGMKLYAEGGARDFNEIPFLRPNGEQYGRLNTTATASVRTLDLKLEYGTARDGGLEVYLGGLSYNRLTLNTPDADATIGMSTGTGYNNAYMSVKNASFGIRSDTTYASLTGADLYIRDYGIAAGWQVPPTVNLNRGQFISDLAGAHDYESIVLLDTGDVAHGMTNVIANTAAFASLAKASAANGGLLIRGLSEALAGVELQGYATTASTLTTTGAYAPISLDAYKKNGAQAGATALAANENIVVFRNAAATQALIKGNGDFYVNGTTGTYDAYDDPALLRALSRELDPAGVIQDEFDRFVHYNRQDLEAAGILAGTMVNQTALGRLLIGAVWQLARRLAALEGTQ